MKTVSLTLKRKVLVIELPRLCDYNLYADVLYIFDNEKNKNHRFKGSYTLLGKPDEIKEEDVLDLVDGFDFNYYVDYNHPNRYAYTHTALESFNSAIEKEIHWVNPWGDRIPIFVGASPSAFKFVEKEKEQWQEAESRTFDRTRTLIFVEN